MYEPFRYPPDLELAKLHQDCTKPGDENPSGRVCPCCGARQKLPIKGWFKRDIRKDFSQYGGSVVTYFSLLKYYAASMLVIILTYSVFQEICMREACDLEMKANPTSKICINPLGLWVVSTQDLTTIMKNYHQLAGRVTTLLILRGITFILLVVVNLLSLYVVSNSRSQRLIKEQPGIQHFALFFKNVNKSQSEEDLKEELSAIDESIIVKDVFFIKRTSKFKTAYDQKLECYFKLQSNSLKQKQRKKVQVKLQQALKILKDQQDTQSKKTGRAVATFASIKNVRLVDSHYRLGFWENIKLKMDLRGTDRMYVDLMPRPEEMLWQYIGKQSHQKVQMKILTFLIMVGLLALSYLLLGKALTVGDVDLKNSLPIVKQVWSTFLALVVVAFALMFRQFMNILSVMRHPNTLTSKTMFIVCTTVIYHFLYFLIIPTIFFLRADQAKQRTLKLHSVSYQALNFVIVQLILAGFDVFYCCWASSSTKLLNNPDNGLCQKQLHDKVTSPRFPMQFKLVILFKSWSFVIFYAFEAPYIMLIIFLTFIFLLVNDKKNLYLHYRMELIDYKVQRLFLSIYTNFFIAYLCFIFIFTQNLTIEIPLALGLSGLAVILQIIYAVQDKRDKHINTDVTLDEISDTRTYRKIYQQYLDSINNPQLDRRIEEYAEQLTRKDSMATGGDSLTEGMLP